MRKIRKRKTNRNLIYGIVFSAMLFLTVGYSVLTTSLNFNITAHKNMGFKVGDQVEVLGLSPTFHVVEVGENTSSYFRIKQKDSLNLVEPL